MTWTLVRKLLRDLRWPLLVIGLLLLAFQLLWAKIAARVLGDLAPFLTRMASFGGFTRKDIENEVFSGPGQVLKSILGGDHLDLDRVMDMLTIGYVHPLIIVILCIWAIGRAAGAIAGEIDRGTMELLLAQPLARARVVLAHLLVDCIVIPALCLSLWSGNFIGAWLISPIEVTNHSEMKVPDALVDVRIPPLKVSFLGLNLQTKEVTVTGKVPFMPPEEPEEQVRERLTVHPWQFGAAMPAVAGLLFAMSGATMWLSSLGRYRFRVLGLAVLIGLLMFLVNVLGQMWDAIAFLRPLTVFYYYNPQAAILGQGWTVPVYGLDVPALLVLVAVGAIGYAMAFWTFTHRDLPAPL
jgi:ABC-2 type transport system permease protein